jgi:hypothetical protein
MPASEREWARRRRAAEDGRPDHEGYGPNRYWRDDPATRSAKVRAGRMLATIFLVLWLAGAILHVAQGAL